MEFAFKNLYFNGPRCGNTLKIMGQGPYILLQKMSLVAFLVYEKNKHFKVIVRSASCE